MGGAPVVLRLKAALLRAVAWARGPGRAWVEAIGGALAAAVAFVLLGRRRRIERAVAPGPDPVYDGQARDLSAEAKSVDARLAASARDVHAAEVAAKPAAKPNWEDMSDEEITRDLRRRGL